MQSAVPAKSFHMSRRKSPVPVISRWIPVPCCGFHERKLGTSVLIVKREDFLDRPEL